MLFAGSACSIWLLINLALSATFLRPSVKNRTFALTAVSPLSTTGVFATLEIPALHISLPVVDGTDSLTLTQGVGHIPGTAMPGGLGNAGFAGHRDTFFRPLRRIAKDMLITLTSREGTYRYLVTSTEIVWPEAVKVLDIHTVPELTLVTCFPFDFIGSAPRRFIVHAKLESVSALAAR